MASFKIHRKSFSQDEKFEIDLTAESDDDPDLSKYVSVTTGHAIAKQGSNKELCSLTDSQELQQTTPSNVLNTICIVQKARDLLNVPFKDVSSHSHNIARPSSHQNLTSVHPKGTRHHSMLFVNSMESSLPACDHGNKPTTHTTISTNHSSDSTGNKFRSKDLSKRNSNSSVITSNIHPTQSPSGESPTSGTMKQPDFFHRKPASSSAYESSNSRSIEIKVSLEDLPSTQLQFSISSNKSMSPAIKNNSTHLKKDLLSRNHYKTISVESQSSISHLKDKKFIVDESQQSPVCIQNVSNMKPLMSQPTCYDNSPDEHLSEYFLPPTKSVCPTVLCKSQNYDYTADTNLGVNTNLSRSTPLCHDIIDSIDGHECSSLSISSSNTSLEKNITPTQSLLPSSNKTEVVSSSKCFPASHSNPFAFQKESVDLCGSTFASPLVHKHELGVLCSSPIKKKLSLKLTKVPASPCLSKNDFTIDIPSEASGKKPSPYQV